LERTKPRLPTSLVEKPGAEIDPETQLPLRVLAASFGNDEPLELALVKPGTYSFGSPSDKRLEAELPKRTVRIEQPFYIAIHETTNAQYQRFADEVGESKAGNRWQRASQKWSAVAKLDPLKNHLPVTNVSAEQAQAFCKWLGGRLPTEIEWESAVRGPEDRGFPLPWRTGEPSPERCQIFYGEDLGAGLGGPVAVEQLAAGAAPLGLMHTIGNAAEWCHDTEQDGGYVLRGCSFGTANIDHVRVTWRARGDVRGEEDTGFRVVIPIDTKGITPPTTATRNSSSPGDAASTAVRVVSSLPWEALLPVFAPMR
jgi:formylglycine-generating enzyme required for sulfatase activity